MRPRFTMRAIAGLILIVLTWAGPAQAWTVTEGIEKSKIYAIPAPAAPAQFSQFFYEDKSQNAYIGFQSSKGPQFYVVNLMTGNGMWLDPGIKPGAAEQFPQDKPVPLPAFGVSGVLDSALLRITGPNDLDQPGGDYQAKLLIREYPYVKKSTIAGAAGERSIFERTLGRGDAIVEIHDKGHKSVLSFREAYEDNSPPYPVFWTPDGRYFIGVQTKEYGAAEVIVNGPFETRLDQEVTSARRAWPVRMYDRAVGDQLFADGELSAKDRYGPPYEDMLRRIEACDSVIKVAGKITSIVLSGLSDVVEYTEDDRTIIQYFRLMFSSEKGGGVINTAIPATSATTGDRTRFKNIFDTVVIINSEGKKDVFCP